MGVAVRLRVGRVAVPCALLEGGAPPSRPPLVLSLSPSPPPGFAGFYAGWHVDFHASALAPLAEGSLARPGPEDRAAMWALAAVRDAGRPGTCVREPQWPGFPPDWRVWVRRGPSGRVDAFAAVTEESRILRVRELAGEEGALAGLLGLLGREALASRLEGVRVEAPPDGALGQLVRRLGGKVAGIHPAPGGPWLGVGDVAALWRALEGDDRRLPAGVAVRLCTPCGEVVLLAARPGVRVVDTTADLQGEVWTVRMSLAALVHGVVGYRSGTDLAEDPDVQAPGPAASALHMLFPPREPFFWAADAWACRP